MVIRDYQQSDAAELAAIFHDAVMTGSAPAYSSEQRRAWAARLQTPAALHDRLEHQTCLIGERNGKAAGFIALEASGHLDMLFVRPEERGKGLAGALHDALIERARAAGHANLSVHASHLARRFLGRRGWTFIRTETVNLGGVRMEHHYMALPLQTPS
ncbi:MAG: GNAT family N-acetyltransferase [Caulobacterales bacterium]|uniref:GNAT family N-acetyltransferase n=1 Tax=Glycocaulis sp. TaxID=1969725 RepID=UPI003FA01150